MVLLAESAGHLLIALRSIVLGLSGRPRLLTAAVQSFPWLAEQIDRLALADPHRLPRSLSMPEHPPRNKRMEPRAGFWSRAAHS